MTKKRNKREYQELLTRYLEGKCSQEELEALDQWYRSFDYASGDTLDMADKDNLPDLKSEMFENITKSINDQELQSKNSHDHERRARKVKVIRLQTLKRLAAVITVGIGLGIFIFSQKNDFSEAQEVNTATLRDERPAEKLSMVNGPATIYLSDGSVIWLNGKSRLKYPEAFTDEVREVTLAGEAFFDVAEDCERPFVIHSTNFTTRVLGTSFKIKDYEHEESQEVEVVTGRVMVSVKAATDSVKELIVKSNRKAVYSKKDNSLVESTAGAGSAQKLSAKSKLRFNEVALKDIVKILNVAHGVNITIASERMRNCIITADLTNETLDVSLAILAKAINAEFTVRAKDIILSGEGCGEARIGK